MVPVRSDRIEMLMPAGIHCLSCGSRALTRSTVSMTLASGFFVMMSSTAGLLSKRADERRLRVARTTLATSPTRTMSPFGMFLTTMFL